MTGPLKVVTVTRTHDEWIALFAGSDACVDGCGRNGDDLARSSGQRGPADRYPALFSDT